MRQEVAEERLDGLERRVSELEHSHRALRTESLARDVDLLRENAVLGCVVKSLAMQALGMTSDQANGFIEEITQEINSKFLAKVDELDTRGEISDYLS